MGRSIACRMKVKTADAERTRELVRQWHAAVVGGLAFDRGSAVFECDPPDGRAHTAVFAGVDAVEGLGLTTVIRDDAKFYRHRDAARPAAEVARRDGTVAGFAGRLSDAFDGDAGTIVVPIKDRPDFEHLEAKGTIPPPTRKRRQFEPKDG